MKTKFNHGLYYCLILIQLQLDLLLFQFGIQSLLITNLLLFIYPKKPNWSKIFFALTAFAIAKFITSSCLISLELILILITALLCQILKRNFIFKNLIFYFILISYLFLSNWLAHKYIFNIIFTITALLVPTIFNLIAGTIMIKVFNKSLES